MGVEPLSRKATDKCYEFTEYNFTFFKKYLSRYNDDVGGVRYIRKVSVCLLVRYVH